MPKQKPTSRPFYVSVSGLGKFFTCPAMYDYSRKYVYTGPLSPALQMGINVHAALAGTKDEEELSTTEAVYLKKLRILELPYEIQGRELQQDVPLTVGIRLVRVVDALARLEGEPVLLDYKTARVPWFTISGHVPEAWGWQASAYLIPPEDVKEWPKQIHFLTAPLEGQPEVHAYSRILKDLDHVKQAALIVRSAVRYGWLPKRQGWLCKNCDFADLCYDVPNWWQTVRLKKEVRNGQDHPE